MVWEKGPNVEIWVRQRSDLQFCIIFGLVMGKHHSVMRLSETQADATMTFTKGLVH